MPTDQHHPTCDDVRRLWRALEARRDAPLSEDDYWDLRRQPWEVCADGTPRPCDAYHREAIRDLERSERAHA